jgi:hypothetical protein
MNCRQPPHTVLFAPGVLRSAQPKHGRGLHGPRRGLHGPPLGTACACPEALHKNNTQNHTLRFTTESVTTIR